MTLHRPVWAGPLASTDESVQSTVIPLDVTQFAGVMTPTVVSVLLRLQAPNLVDLEGVSERMWAHTPDGKLLIHQAPAGSPAFQATPFMRDMSSPFSVTIPRLVAPAVDVTYELVARRVDGEFVALAAYVPTSFMESLPLVAPSDPPDMEKEVLDQALLARQTAFLSTMGKFDAALAILPAEDRTHVYGVLKAEALASPEEVAP